MNETKKPKLLTQNSKMKKSSSAGTLVYNWTIPAFQSVTGLKTCPNAGTCSAGCYARSGTYRFSNVVSAHEAKLALTLKPEFETNMINEIEGLSAKKGLKKLYIRIHDAGDFYNAEYLTKWINIIKYFESDEHVTFYAYTKQVELLKSIELPDNFKVTFSYGGKQDSLIDKSKDRHASVFESELELSLAGYVDGTNDDLVAGKGLDFKIGLVYHGAKSYKNTLWSNKTKGA